MSVDFDLSAIERHGWRQGAVLGAELLRVAGQHAPKGVVVGDDDWLVVTSHDCDVVNDRLEREPMVEILRAVIVDQKAPDKQRVWGRNPRSLEVSVDGDAGAVVVIRANVHERWLLPRELLSGEPPVRVLGTKPRRLVAEWLAKRYIRAAFPNAFDRRWRTMMRDWTRLLEAHSESIQGVYLRLNTLDELPEGTPYKVHLIVATPKAVPAETREAVKVGVESFWNRFSPGVECVGVEVLGTNQLTLADIGLYQRFDADWVSFGDDSLATPAVVDMPA